MILDERLTLIHFRIKRSVGLFFHSVANFCLLANGRDSDIGKIEFKNNCVMLKVSNYFKGCPLKVLRK